MPSWFLVQRREADLLPVFECSIICPCLTTLVWASFVRTASLLLAEWLRGISWVVIKRTCCWIPAVTFPGRIWAKASHGAFWRDQSILYCRLEGDNILIKVTRKQIKWPQNMGLETPKLKDTTLLLIWVYFHSAASILFECNSHKREDILSCVTDQA